MKIKKNVAISDSGFLFNPKTGESFSLNPIGVEVFNMLKESKSQEEVSKTITSAYETDESTFEKDFNDFVGMLKQYQIIEPSDEKED